jgi:hypothetical protein
MLSKSGHGCTQLGWTQCEAAQLPTSQRLARFTALFLPRLAANPAPISPACYPAFPGRPATLRSVCCGTAPPSHGRLLKSCEPVNA